jgi:antitoxin PrlF
LTYSEGVTTKMEGRAYRSKLRSKGQLTLPPEIREALHVKEGDDIEFAIDEGGNVSVRGFITIPADQAWFFTPEWQAGEREADAEIARGEGMIFEDGESFEAYLRSIVDEDADEDR